MAESLKDQIQDYKNGSIDHSWDKWELFFVSPWAKAYNKAWDNFQQTLKDQKESDALKREMAFMAISLLGGSIFTAALGNLVLKNAAKIGDVSSASDLEKILKLAGYVGSKEVGKTTQFVIGKMAGDSYALISSETKRTLSESKANYPAVDEFLSRPLEMFINLRSFFKNCKIQAYAVLTDLHEKAKSGVEEQAVQNAFQTLKRSHFCNAPNQMYLPAEQKLIDRIELAMYMKYVLNSDHLVTREYVPSYNRLVGPGLGVFKQSVNVQASPSGSQYPKRTITKRLPGVINITAVEYGDIGQSIIEAMNAVYKRHYAKKEDFISSFWWGETANLKMLVRAEQVLKDLKQSNLNLVRVSRAGI